MTGDRKIYDGLTGVSRMDSDVNHEGIDKVRIIKLFY
jgi:hypothetical protein